MKTKTDPADYGACDWCQKRKRPCYGTWKNGRCKLEVSAQIRATKKKNDQSDEITYRIYALLDPRNGQTNYIGCTRNKPEYRLMGHISVSTDSRDLSGRYKGPLAGWIREVVEDGYRPTIVILNQTNNRLLALRMEVEAIQTERDKPAGCVTLLNKRDIRTDVKRMPLG